MYSLFQADDRHEVIDDLKKSHNIPNSCSDTVDITEKFPDRIEESSDRDQLFSKKKRQKLLDTHLTTQTGPHDYSIPDTDECSLQNEKLLIKQGRTKNWGKILADTNKNLMNTFGTEEENDTPGVETNESIILMCEDNSAWKTEEFVLETGIRKAKEKSSITSQSKTVSFLADKDVEENYPNTLPDTDKTTIMAQQMKIKLKKKDKTLKGEMDHNDIEINRGQLDSIKKIATNIELEENSSEDNGTDSPSDTTCNTIEKELAFSTMKQISLNKEHNVRGNSDTTTNKKLLLSSLELQERNNNGSEIGKKSKKKHKKSMAKTKDNYEKQSEHDKCKTERVAENNQEEAKDTLQENIQTKKVKMPFDICGNELKDESEATEEKGRKNKNEISVLGEKEYTTQTSRHENGTSEKELEESGKGRYTSTKRKHSLETDSPAQKRENPPIDSLTYFDISERATMEAG